MTTPDTSVVVAAFARWHERHDVAATAVAEAGVLVAQVAIETFSVLTRLPAPHRVPPALVVEFLDRHFAAGIAALAAASYRDLLSTAAARRVVGGAVYDALVAASATAAGATLVTLDERASSTYAAVGADYVLLA